MKRLSLIPALLLLTACAAFVAPQTPTQALAHADAQFSAAVNTASDLRDQGVLTADDVQAIDPIIHRGDELLTLAWQALDAGDGDTTMARVRTLNRILIELSKQLEEAQ